MIDKDMDTTCKFGESVKPTTPNQPHMMTESQSNQRTWNINATQAHESMEQDEKNDSGIVSGSDCHSRSPGSDSYLMSENVPIRLYPTPIFVTNPYPLTPPSDEKDTEVAPLTPRASPNHLKNLERSLQKTLQSSPTNSENSMDDRSGNDTDDFDESIRVPKVNSLGKVKTFKCKQCDHVANTKVEHWSHAAVHIREDKRLLCPKCPFVTEYKHHLEYHLNNHAGAKPFKCELCEYTCVNKSMLNSHMKSHSDVHCYNCHDCNYSTKYCHSFKLHLRRYKHKQGLVLDKAGKPCPDFIVDVYGTRRGPKLKTQPRNEEVRPEPQPFNLNLLPGVPPFQGYPFFPGLPNAQFLQQIIERQAMVAAAVAAAPEPQVPVVAAEPEPEPEPEVLDLSKPGSSGIEKRKNRRKGIAFKMDPAAVESEDDDESTTTMFSNVEAVVKEEKEEKSMVPDDNNNKKESVCHYCDISFGDEILHHIHMGYHGFNSPFTCNMCGVECPDRVTFFMHIARVSHRL